MYCGSKTKVTNSRARLKGLEIWRRRTCTQCGAIYTTGESIEEDKSIVVEHDGRLEPFLRDHLLISVYESLRHRKTALEDASALTDTIMTRLRPHFAQGKILPAIIQENTLAVLNNFDTAASVHYAAFHNAAATN